MFPDEPRNSPGRSCRPVKAISDRFRPLRPVPRNVTILSQSKTKPNQRRNAELTSDGENPDAPHNRVAVRQPDHTCPPAAASAQNATPRNLILFVPDGLRGRIVTPQTAPAMAEVRDKGVNFKNSHSLFPTFTMANGSAMASGHYLGDTGTFSNTIYTGYSSVPAGDTVVPFIENDAVLGDIDEHFNGDYLNEETILKMARAKGFSHRGDRQARPDLSFRPYRRWQEHDRDRRLHRRQEWRAAVRRNEGRADQGRPAAGDAPARRKRQGRRRQDAGHHDGECRAAGLHGRRRRQGRAADVQGAQQAVRAGVLVARSRRQPAQYRRQPQHHHPRDQRADLDGRHQERRQQSRPAAQGAGRTRPRRLDQHHRFLRSWLLDDFEGKQDQSVGEDVLRRHAEGFPARWASLRSILRRR